MDALLVLIAILTALVAVDAASSLWGMDGHEPRGT
jgi:hypothetical protein